MTTLPAIPPSDVVRQSPFAPGLKTFQIAWDSTSLGLFKECPRKYYYQIILGWQPRGTNVHLLFGQLYHKALEVYDHATFAGADHEEGVRAAVRAAIEGAGDYVMLDGVRVWRPWRSDSPYKNVWTLCRSIVWYLDYFKNSVLKTLVLSNGKPAVELSFYFPVFDVSGFQVGLSGHLDRVVIDPATDSESIMDRKTTKAQLNDRFWNQFSPHNQFTLYTIAGNVHYERPTWGITVDAAQVLVNETRFARKFIGRPPGVVNEWLAESRMWVQQALVYAEANYWPMNDKSCSNYGGCPFAKVCARSPVQRKNWLEADFEHRIWNPLEIRGDV